MNRFIMLGIGAGLFGASFVLPVLPAGVRSYETVKGYEVFAAIFSPDMFRNAPGAVSMAVIALWGANAVMLAALGLLFFGQTRWAGLAGIVSVLFATLPLAFLGFAAEGRGPASGMAIFSVLGIGYWTWVGSMLVTGIGSYFTDPGNVVIARATPPRGPTA